MARLAARCKLGRARVSLLNALGLHNLLAMAGIISTGASEHLTQLRAADTKELACLSSIDRLSRIYGRLSALRIRITITYSPNPWR